jgi:hypothetical protein
MHPTGTIQEVQTGRSRRFFLEKVENEIAES